MDNLFLELLLCFFKFILDINDNKYRVSIKVNNIIPFLNNKDEINITYEEKNEIKEIIKLEK